MKRNQKNRARAGFSLVEVIAAILVLGIVVAAVTTSFVTSIQFNARAERQMQAELAVSNAVEQLMAEGFDGVAFETSDYSVSDVHSDETPDAVPVTIGYTLTVTSKADPNIAVTTYVHAKEVSP